MRINDNYLNGRRDFLKTVGVCAALAFLGQALPRSVYAKQASPRKEVAYYKKFDSGAVQCQICPRYCMTLPGGRGVCGNKINDDGTYYTLVYSKPCSINVDPIEKKPFFHLLPGAAAYSLATAGCNFKCLFCQNWQISQALPENMDYYDMTPAMIVEQAKKRKSEIIAFTYGEPVVFYEYMYDIAELAKKNGLHPVMVSNGYINKEPLKALCRHLSAVKIDLKSFSDEFYRKYCNGRLQPVLDTLLTLKELGTWYEIVVLLIPTLNDSDKEIRAMCNWIKSNLGDSVPVHFSRFHPMFKLTNLPDTPVKTLLNAHKIATGCGLKFVYVGNVTPNTAEATYCPSCGKVLVKRVGHVMTENVIRGNKCPECSTVIPGFWAVEKK